MDRSEEHFSWEEAAEDLVFHLTLEHPTPWRVESDWAEEVIASDGHVVAKCRSLEAAESLVALAEKIGVKPGRA